MSPVAIEATSITEPGPAPTTASASDEPSPAADSARTPARASATAATPAQIPAVTDNLSLFQTRMAGDLAVTLTVAPGSPGRNEINAFFFDTNGDDRDVREVVVLLTYLEFGNLTLTRSLSEAHPGHVFLIGEHFSHSGRWRIEAVFRREGLDDIRVAFDVTIR